MTIVYKHPEGHGAVLTASGEQMSRVDAEALGYTVAPYVDLVAPSARFAARHPEYSDLAILPPFGLTVTDQTARAMGFALSALPLASAAKPSRPDPQASWRSTIMKLADANKRPSATAELLTSQTPETLSIEAARAFLRGLPVETEQDTTEEIMTTNDDPRAARRAEIAASVQSFNRDRGWAKPQSAAPKPAPAVSSVEPEKLKRLAEIEGSVASFNRDKGWGGAATRPALKQLAESRLNELVSNGKARSEEAKSLKLALDAHSATGAPLDRMLMQFGISESNLT